MPNRLFPPWNVVYVRNVTPGVLRKACWSKFSTVIIQDSLYSDGCCFVYRRNTKLHRQQSWVLALAFSKVVVRTPCDLRCCQLLKLWIFQMLHSSSQPNPVLPQNKHDTTNHILENHWTECCLWEPQITSWIQIITRQMWCIVGRVWASFMEYLCCTGSWISFSKPCFPKCSKCY